MPGPRHGAAAIRPGDSGGGKPRAREVISWWWLLIAFLLGAALGTAVAGWFLFHQACRMLIRIFELLEASDEAIWEVARRKKPPGGP